MPIPTRQVARSPMPSASPRAFLSAFTETWGARLTGGLSVPSTIAAFIFTSALAKVLFGIFAAVCFCIASYQVWRKERERAEHAEGRLRPRIRFNADLPAC